MRNVNLSRRKDKLSSHLTYEEFTRLNAGG